ASSVSPCTPMTWRSYAKVNLYLDVLGKRRDGYHTIETLFQTVSLFDELTFSEDAHISMTCSREDLDTGSSNLVCQAARLLKESTGYPGGARIHLNKRIPIAAGLAGGSGNAAAVLLALNALWGLKLPLPRLVPLARKLGADVPYCLYGGTVMARLRGDSLTQLPPISGIWFVLVHPPIAVSAGQVYSDPLLKHSNEISFAGRTPAFRKAIAALALGDLKGTVFNRMEVPVFEENRSLEVIKSQLLELGCEAAAMSGSGPTIFGICRSQQQALQVVKGLKQQGVTEPTSIVSTISVGVEPML
ncbi:MAG: 4-(cytidine 5'-diphospho)-2-C-methyl-D-erythritol kinase, partial [Candidatus Hydrogenedentes bacterium]|nr:4-(cytidine 5'-diphospho)-2-C-methyl-D-erythritol kinase [Candidatus Hydrogenedentota bacterium]